MTCNKCANKICWINKIKSVKYHTSPWQFRRLGETLHCTLWGLKARVLVHPMTTVAPNTSLLLAWSVIFILSLASSTKTLVFCNSCSRPKTIPCFSLGSRLYSGWPRLRGTRSSGKSDLSQLVDFWIFINKVVKHCTCFICNLVCYNILCLNHLQFH